MKITTTTAHEKAVLALLTALCEAFGQKLSDALHGLYVLALDDIDAETIEASLTRLLKTCKFLPKPAEIREACGCFTRTEKPSLAWASFRQSLRSLSENDSVCFDDPIVNATIRAMGGWIAVHDWTSEEIAYRERDFLRHYAALQNLDLPESQTEGFIGINEREAKAWGVGRIERVIVGCLSVGSNGIRRIAAPLEVKKIEGQRHFLTHAVASFKSIEHKGENHAQQTTAAHKSREQLIDELRRWDQAEAWRKDKGWIHAGVDEASLT